MMIIVITVLLRPGKSNVRVIVRARPTANFGANFQFNEAHAIYIHIYIYIYTYIHIYTYTYIDIHIIYLYI